MTSNSRALSWLKSPGGSVHAFRTRRDGSPSTSVCRQYMNPGKEWEQGSYRHDRTCSVCKSRYTDIPKRVGEPCDTPQPNGKGNACRTCNFAIHPTYPGWVHEVRA